MEVVSRKDAKARGDKYYFTGTPCSRGHIDVRFVSSFNCKACCCIRSRTHYHSLPVTTRKQRRDKKAPYTREWAKANRHKQAIYNSRRKIKDPDCYKRHYAANRERRKAESRAWYRANPERHAQRQRAYDAKRPVELKRAIGRKARAKRRAIEKRLFVEAVDARVVFDRDKGICGICRAPVDHNSRWEVDHVIPISKGGAHSYANVQLAHRRCNRSKHATLPSAVNG